MHRSFTNSRPDRLLVSLLVHLQQFPRLPEDGRVAGRVLRDVQHVLRRRQRFRRIDSVRVRSKQNVARPGGDAAVFQYEHDLRRFVARRHDRHQPTTGRFAKLRSRSWRHDEHARVLEVSRGLEYAGEFNFHRTDCADRGVVFRSVRRDWNVYSSIRNYSTPGFIVGPADVSPRLPQFWRSRSVGGQPQRNRRLERWYSLVRDSFAAHYADSFPTGHVRAGFELSLDG